LTLAGCTHFESLDSVPYDLNGMPSVRVRERHLVVPPDLGTFTNDAPSNVPGSPRTASLRSAYFVVVNRGDRALRIRVRALPGDWTDFTIERGEGLTFTCEACTEHWVQVAVPTTGQTTLVRTIGLQDRYEIFWDNGHGRWDLRPIQ
jgi:hypothetical protein